MGLGLKGEGLGGGGGGSGDQVPGMHSVLGFNLHHKLMVASYHKIAILALSSVKILLPVFKAWLK